MHQQVVLRIVFQADVVRHAGGIRNGRHTGVADERVDLVAFLEEEVEELHEEHAGEGGDHERQGADDEDLHGFPAEELAGLRGGTDGDTDQDGDDVHQRTAGRVGQTLGHAAFLEQVAEEEHTEQRNTGGHDEGRQQEADDREEFLLGRGDRARGLHTDEALLLGGQQAHDRRLDHRHEGHIGISRHGDGTHQVRSQAG